VDRRLLEISEEVNSLKPVGGGSMHCQKVGKGNLSRDRIFRRDEVKEQAMAKKAGGEEGGGKSFISGAQAEVGDPR